MIKLEFKKEDCWIGLYWEKTIHDYVPSGKDINGIGYIVYEIDIWICIIPMLPIHIKWFQK